MRVVIIAPLVAVMSGGAVAATWDRFSSLHSSENEATYCVSTEWERGTMFAVNTCDEQVWAYIDVAGGMDFIGSLSPGQRRVAYARVGAVDGELEEGVDYEIFACSSILHETAGMVRCSD